MVCIKRNDKMKPSLSKEKRWSPQTREASSQSLLETLSTNRNLTKDVIYQLNEGSDRDEESDSPIVVRDGKTDHKAKGWAEKHRSQSTHARGRNAPKRSVSSALTALNLESRRRPETSFSGSLTADQSAGFVREISEVEKERRSRSGRRDLRGLRK